MNCCPRVVALVNYVFLCFLSFAAMDVERCNICLREVEICYNFGGICCKSCAAFFRRWVRSGHFLDCKNNSQCGMSPASNMPMCRKCRMTKCLAEGLNPIYVHEAKPQSGTVALPTPRKRIFRVFNTNSDFPLLSGMTEAVRFAFQYRPARSPNADEHFGTSELRNYSTFSRIRVCSFEELKVFRCMLDRTPLISDLDAPTKEQIFKNSMLLYRVFISFLNNLQQCPGDNKRRYYNFVNTYVDISLIKIKELFMSYRPPTSLAKRFDDYTLLAQELMNYLRYCQELCSSLQVDVLGSEEDVAALILIIIIHSNKTGGHLKVEKLKTIWAELDKHFRLNCRDPAAWGSMILLLSGLQTAAMQYKEVLHMIQLIMGNSMYQMFVRTPKFDNCTIDGFVEQ